LLGRLLSVAVGNGPLFGNVVLFIDVAALIGTFALLFFASATPRVRLLVSLALGCQAAVVALLAVGVRPLDAVTGVSDLYNVAAFVAIAGFACLAAATGASMAVKGLPASALGDRVRLPPRVKVER
jgi:hypothetical protein